MTETVYVLTVGWGLDDDQRDRGAFSSLLKAQQAAPQATSWEEIEDRLGEGTVRAWEGYVGDLHVPEWIYEYEVDHVYD